MKLKDVAGYFAEQTIPSTFVQDISEWHWICKFLEEHLVTWSYPLYIFRKIMLGTLRVIVIKLLIGKS